MIILVLDSHTKISTWSPTTIRVPNHSVVCVYSALSLVRLVLTGQPHQDIHVVTNNDQSTEPHSGVRILSAVVGQTGPHRSATPRYPRGHQQRSEYRTTQWCAYTQRCRWSDWSSLVSHTKISTWSPTTIRVPNHTAVCMYSVLSFVRLVLTGQPHSGVRILSAVVCQTGPHRSATPRYPRGHQQRSEYRTTQWCVYTQRCHWSDWSSPVSHSGSFVWPSNTNITIT